MLLFLILFASEFLLRSKVVFGIDYCKFSPKHMLCDGGGCVQPKCGGEGDYIFEDITKAEIEEILDSHNKLRSEVASGKVTGGHGKPFPKAANMEEMKWDSELANVAAGMVKKCEFKHHCTGTASCRRTDRHASVGENIFYRGGTGYSLQDFHKTKYESASKAWFFEEKDFFDPADIPKWGAGINSLGKSYKDHGHFTQMIWWNSRRLGCAKITYKGQKPRSSEQLITCLYAPAGNFLGSPVYEIGEPCDKCKGVGRTCSKKYQGLCGLYCKCS